MSNFDLINLNNVTDSFETFKSASPFDHCVIENFFKPEIANQLSDEIPDFDSEFWHEYSNPLEIKKTCNDWNRFPKLTYNAFSFLNSELFVNYLKGVAGVSSLFADSGLNGGGWHIHSNGGKLNPHLDYSLHPKVTLQRKLNIIIYLEKEWQPQWGGYLGLYTNKDCKVKDVEVEIEPKFNRAIFFDTTQDSWHGLSREVSTPEGVCRKSMALYYLTIPPHDVDTRAKALFSPTEDQAEDDSVEELIRKRCNVKSASSFYR